MALLEIRPKSLVNPKSTYLHSYRKNVTSQLGEDGVIEKIFEIAGSPNRWCVEFGAWDGRHFSNTWSLLNMNGWNGVLIEGDRDRFVELETNYRGKKSAVLFNTYIQVDGHNSLDAILQQTDVPEDFDFLSVDVDGMDWYIWDSLAGYRPSVVVIEFNPTIPNDIYFVQDRDMSVNHGSSLLAMIDLAKRKGYELVATTEWNAFFVREDLFPLFGIQDNDIDAMHSAGRFESRLFQLYDGTLVLGGCTHLVWKGIPIHQNDVQILPVALRMYG